MYEVVSDSEGRVRVSDSEGRGGQSQGQVCPVARGNEMGHTIAMSLYVFDIRDDFVNILTRRKLNRVMSPRLLLIFYFTNCINCYELKAFISSFLNELRIDGHI